MRFNFNILQQMEKSLDQGVTDLKPQKIERRRITDTAPELPTQPPETTLVQPDSFISTEGLSYTPLPVANQFIIETLFA